MKRNLLSLSLFFIIITLFSVSVSALPSAVESYEAADEICVQNHDEEYSDEAILAASSGACGTSLTYTIDDEGTMTVSGSGNMYTWRRETLVSWYSARKLIKKVVLEEGVENVGRYAFNSCDNLESIVIPDSVTSIGNEAFYGCKKLSEIKGCKSITSIGDRAFYGCALLTELRVPEGVTAIGPETFFGCAEMKTLCLPDSLEKIGEAVFSGCAKLTQINLGSGITAIPDNAFYGCASLTSVDIPDGVTSIGASAFEGCSKITSADIPENVGALGEGAFKGCARLTNTKIPEGIEYLSDYLFDGCTRLSEITLPSSLISIGYRSFADCTWFEEITIPENVKNIGKMAFYNCSSLMEIAIPDRVSNIGEGAFRDCGYLLSISIGKNLSSMGNNAFYGCDYLEKITVNKENMYFSNDESGVLFDKGMKNLLKYPAWCKTDSYKVPEGTQTISEGAFTGAYYLRSVELPESVKTVETTAFDGCSKLAGIKFPDGIEKIAAGAIDKRCTMYGSAGSYAESYAQENGLNFAGLTGDVIQPSKIYLSSTSQYVNVGKIITVTATVAPHFEGYTTNENVIWTSENEEVATVDNGVITTLSKGGVYIYASSEDGSCSASVWVSISQPATGVELDKEKITLRVGETKTVTATVYPENASNKYVYWSSSNSNVAKVSSGKITAIGLGTAVITVRTSSGSFTDTVEVNVVEYVAGEINGDNTVDMNDAILLLQHSMFPELYPLDYAGNADFTGDGVVDMNDAILLLQHSMFPELYPIG